MSRRILIVTNPVAARRHREGLPEACARSVTKAGHRAEVAYTEGPGDARRLAREARDDFDIVAALGGDGTLGQVADGLVGGRAAVGIIPAGTRNVIAREVGMPLRPEAAAAALGDLPLRPLSLGWANGHHFVLCVSAGIDAVVMQRALRGSRGRLTVPALVRALSGILIRGSWPVVRVEGPDGPVEGALAVVANARGYGGLLRMAPDASLAEGKLHVCVVRGATRRALLRALAGMISGGHVRRPDVSYFACDQVRVEAADTAVDWERDGDLEGSLPLEARAVPEALLLASPLSTVRPGVARSVPGVVGAAMGKSPI